MQKQDCKKDWIGKGIFIYCPIHKEYFKHNQNCKYYEIVSCGTDPLKSRDTNLTPLDELGAESNTPQSRDIGIVNSDIAQIRSHAFTFTLEIKNPKNWENKIKILKENDIACKPKKSCMNKVLMIEFRKHKIWLSEKSVVIYFPNWKSYFVNQAREGYNYAIADLYSLLHDLEMMFQTDFKIDGRYKFRVSRQHHAIIHNSLAKQYNREHKKLEVHDEKGKLWLLIDNSDPYDLKLEELETVDKDMAVPDNDLVKTDFNELRTTGLTRKVIGESLKAVADSLKASIDMQTNESKKWSYYGSMMEEHVGAIKDLRKEVKKFSKAVSGLKPKKSLSKKQKFINKYK